MSEIDWSDPKSKISINFTVGEALYLPTFGVYHIPSEEEKNNIIEMSKKMEMIRAYLNNNPININCWIRPVYVNCTNKQFCGKNYNALVGGAKLSAHIYGKAVDFTVSKITCNEVRELLVPKLEEFNIRMEKKNNAGWVHCDNAWSEGKTRYFIP